MAGADASSPHRCISVSFCPISVRGSDSDVIILDVLDGGMIVLAMYTLNIFHPGFLLIDTAENRRGEGGSQIGLKETKGDVTELVIPAS